MRTEGDPARLIPQTDQLNLNDWGAATGLVDGLLGSYRLEDSLAEAKLRAR